MSPKKQPKFKKIRHWRWFERMPVDYMYLDLETAAHPDMEKWTDAPKPDGRLTDPAKIAEDVRKKTEALKTDVAPLDWNAGRIVCLTWALAEDEPVCRVCPDEQHEAWALKAAWKAFDEAWDAHLVGYRIRQFDLPFMVMRSRHLGVEVSGMFRRYSRYPKRLIDLFDEIYSYEQDKFCMRRTLTRMCERFGLGPYPEDVEGSEIPKLVAEGNWDAIKQHNLLDVIKTRDLANKIL